MLDPGQILDGSYLNALANEHAIAFSFVIAPSRPPETTILWGTICSGGEGVAFVMKALGKLYADMGVKPRFVHRFSCEVKPSLQDFILAVKHEAGDTTTDGAPEGDMQFCLFERAEDMGKPFAKCVRHSKLCPVPRVDLLIFGTSCKDLSRASNVYKSSMLVMNMQVSTGGSAQTFGGAEAYLLKHAVDLILFENSDALDDAGDLTSQQTNLQIVGCRLQNTGFVVKVFLMDSSLFGLPQCRRRYYITGVKDGAATNVDFSDRSAAAVLDVTENLVRLCQRKPPCASKLLLDEDDPAIDDELNRRLAMGDTDSRYNVCAAISTFQGAGLSWGSVDAQRDTQESPWYTTLANGQRNVLTYSEAQDKEAMFRDIGQSSSRVRLSHKVEDKHILFCQMPGQLVWVRRDGKLPRLQMGREALIFQGYPIASIPSTVSAVSERMLQEIAGNMMSIPVLLALLQSLFAALPWRGHSTSTIIHTSAHDVDEAMAIYTSLTSSNVDTTDTPPQKRLRRLKMNRASGSTGDD